MRIDLAKLDDGLDESPILMVGDKKKIQKNKEHTETQSGFRQDQHFVPEYYNTQNS